MSYFQRREPIDWMVKSRILSDMSQFVTLGDTQALFVIEPVDGIKPMKPICTEKYEILLNKPEKFSEYLQKTKVETPKIGSKVKSIKNKKAIKLSKEIDAFIKNLQESHKKYKN